MKRPASATSAEAPNARGSAALYDTIGAGYAPMRRADPRLYAEILTALGRCRSVVNVGAGTGSYEPADRRVVAVEPSRLMIAQRPPDAGPSVVSVAERLPIADRSVEAAMTIFSVHHWSDIAAGIAE